MLPWSSRLLDAAELYPDPGAGEPRREVILSARAGLPESAPLSQRWRGLDVKEGDRDGRRRRDERGERLLRGGGESLRTESGDRLRGGREGDLARLEARLRLLALSRLL